MPYGSKKDKKEKVIREARSREIMGCFWLCVVSVTIITAVAILFVFLSPGTTAGKIANSVMLVGSFLMAVLVGFYLRFTK